MLTNYEGNDLHDVGGVIGDVDSGFIGDVAQF